MYMPEEKTLSQQVEDTIRSQTGLQDRDIDVSVDEKIVTLKGVADSSEERQRIVEAVRLLPGVQAVSNELRIRGEGSQTAGEYLDDSMITAAIKAKLLGEKGISSFKIHVETKDGIVDMKGEIDTRDHSDLAARVARSAEGVREVRNHLTIAP